MITLWIVMQTKQFSVRDMNRIIDQITGVIFKVTGRITMDNAGNIEWEMNIFPKGGDNPSNAFLQEYVLKAIESGKQKLLEEEQAKCQTTNQKN